MLKTDAAAVVSTGSGGRIQPRKLTLLFFAHFCFQVNPVHASLLLHAQPSPSPPGGPPSPL